MRALSESADTKERVLVVVSQLEFLANSLEVSIDTLSEESLLCINKLVSLFTLSGADGLQLQYFKVLFSEKKGCCNVKLFIQVKWIEQI